MAWQKWIWLVTIHEDTGSIPGLAISCGVGHRRSLDPALLCLWCKPAAAALIWPLAWEPPYAASAALEKKTKKTKKVETLATDSYDF